MPTSQHSTVAAAAESFAHKHHQGQYRKGTGLDYVVHPVNVAHILRQHYPDDPALEVAGFLHDVVEDTEVKIDEIERRFGADVAYLVWGVTLRPGWTLGAYVYRHPRVLRLKAADTLDNVLDTTIGLEKGNDVWAHFAAGRRKLETWTKHLWMMKDGIRDEPLVARLEEALERVAAL